MVGRTASKLEGMVSTFPTNYNIQVVDNQSQLDSVPRVAIGTIPADKPIDPSMRETLCRMFEQAQQADGTVIGKSVDEKNPRVLLEMAYKPSVTALMQLASDAGWKTIPGLEVLTGQGVNQVCIQRYEPCKQITNSRQFIHWTGITPLYHVARVSLSF